MGTDRTFASWQRRDNSESFDLTSTTNWLHVSKKKQKCYFLMLSLELLHTLIVSIDKRYLLLSIKELIISICAYNHRETRLQRHQTVETLTENVTTSTAQLELFLLTKNFLTTSCDLVEFVLLDPTVGHTLNPNR